MRVVWVVLERGGGPYPFADWIVLLRGGALKSLVAEAMDVFVAVRAGGAYPLIDSEVLLRGGGP